MNNYFGYNLKYLRKRFNLTQPDVAEIVKRTAASVSRWESEEIEPSDRIVKKLADHFGLTPAELMYTKLDERLPTSEKSDLFQLLELAEKMDEKQFARLLAYREGLTHAGL